MVAEGNSYIVFTRKVEVNCESQEWVDGAYKRRSGKKKKSKMKMQETFQFGSNIPMNKKPKGFKARWHDLKQWAKKAYRKAKPRRKSENTEETTNATTQEAEKTQNNAIRHRNLENTEERTSQSECHKAVTQSNPAKKTWGIHSPVQTDSEAYKSWCTETHTIQHQTMVKETHDDTSLQRKLCSASDDSKKVAIKSSHTQTESLPEKEYTTCHHQRILEEHSDHSDDNNPKSTEDLDVSQIDSVVDDLDSVDTFPIEDTEGKSSISYSQMDSGFDDNESGHNTCLSEDMEEKINIQHSQMDSGFDDYESGYNTCLSEDMEEKINIQHSQGEKDTDLEAVSSVCRSSLAEEDLASTRLNMEGEKETDLVAVSSVCRISLAEEDLAGTRLNMEGEKHSDPGVVSVICGTSFGVEGFTGTCFNIKEEKDIDPERTSSIYSTSSGEEGNTSINFIHPFIKKPLRSALERNKEGENADMKMYLEIKEIIRQVLRRLVEKYKDKVKSSLSKKKQLRDRLGILTLVFEKLENVGSKKYLKLINIYEELLKGGPSALTEEKRRMCIEISKKDLLKGGLGGLDEEKVRMLKGIIEKNPFQYIDRYHTGKGEDADMKNSKLPKEISHSTQQIQVSRSLASGCVWWIDNGVYNKDTGMYQSPMPKVNISISCQSKYKVERSPKDLLKMIQFPEKYLSKLLNGEGVLVDNKNRLKTGIYIVTDEDFRNAATNSTEPRLTGSIFHPHDCRLPVVIPVTSEEYLGRKAENNFLLEETERLRGDIERQLLGKHPTSLT